MLGIYDQSDSRNTCLTDEKDTDIMSNLPKQARNLTEDIRLSNTNKKVKQ